MNPAMVNRNRAANHLEATAMSGCSEAVAKFEVGYFGITAQSLRRNRIVGKIHATSLSPTVNYGEINYGSF